MKERTKILLIAGAIGQSVRQGAAGKDLGTKKTLVYVSLVVVMATLTGFIFGAFVS